MEVIWIDDMMKTGDAGPLAITLLGDSRRLYRLLLGNTIDR